ncbi:hypothetical protein PR048_022577 [Dryococelus australis]|uniref:Uncharacterized protein n=1 Tax=Dryococelus australis TaxID=614101 RepID=A0ABQ9H1G6_9NEOP|nr:hypothetical protein PR048_022577 [Dryococelus australis]
MLWGGVDARIGSSPPPSPHAPLLHQTPGTLHVSPRRIICLSDAAAGRDTGRLHDVITQRYHQTFPLTPFNPQAHTLLNFFHCQESLHADLRMRPQPLAIVCSRYLHTVQYLPMITPDFRTCESCRTMPLFGGVFSGISRFPALAFRRCSILTSPSSVLKTSMSSAARISPLRYLLYVYMLTLTLRRRTESSREGGGWGTSTLWLPRRQLKYKLATHCGCLKAPLYFLCRNYAFPCHYFRFRDISVGQYQLGFPLVDERPTMNDVKYRKVSDVVWTNRTMVIPSTDTNRNGVLAVLDMAEASKSCHDQARIAYSQFVAVCSGGSIEAGNSFALPVALARSKTDGIRARKPFPQRRRHGSLAIFPRKFSKSLALQRKPYCKSRISATEVAFAIGSQFFSTRPGRLSANSRLTRKQVASDILSGVVQHWLLSGAAANEPTAEAREYTGLWSPPYSSKPDIPKYFGTAVAERLACSPPRPGHSWIFACGNRAARFRWSEGFLGDLPFLPPFHSTAALYSPRSSSLALNTSLRATQIRKAQDLNIVCPRLLTHAAGQDSSTSAVLVVFLLPHISYHTASLLGCGVSPAASSQRRRNNSHKRLRPVEAVANTLDHCKLVSCLEAEALYPCNSCAQRECIWPVEEQKDHKNRFPPLKTG